MPTIKYTIQELADVINGDVICKGYKNQVIKDILIDSRRLITPEKCIFFAIVTKKNDGHKYIDEVGTMNIFFVIDDELITPPLEGSILGGITSDSTIHLARDWGMKVYERRISIDEIIERSREDRLKGAFGTGTAAVISPVGEIRYKDITLNINDGKIGPIARRLYDEITGIQYGEKPDKYGWIYNLCQ